MSSLTDQGTALEDYAEYSKTNVFQALVLVHRSGQSRTQYALLIDPEAAFVLMRINMTLLPKGFGEYMGPLIMNYTGKSDASSTAAWLCRPMSKA